jgi:hypothetical protein
VGSFLQFEASAMSTEIVLTEEEIVVLLVLAVAVLILVAFLAVYVFHLHRKLSKHNQRTSVEAPRVLTREVGVCVGGLGVGPHRPPERRSPDQVIQTLRQKHACAESDAAGDAFPVPTRKKATVGVVLDDAQLGLVSMVLPGGPAYKRIKKGDLIMSLDGTSVTAENLIPLLGGSDEVHSTVKIGIKGCRDPIEIRRADIREVEKIKNVFVNLATLQEVCKASRSLLQLINAVESAAEDLLATKGRHIHDLEDAVVTQAQRGDAHEARCKYLEEQLQELQGPFAEQRAASEREQMKNVPSPPAENIGEKDPPPLPPTPLSPSLPPPTLPHCQSAANGARRPSMIKQACEADSR